MGEVFDSLKKHYEENEVYCSGCLEHMTMEHWMLCTWERPNISKEELEDIRMARKLLGKQSL